MNHSDAPTGENGNRKLEQYQQMNVKEIAKESLAEKWADFLQDQTIEGHIEYGQQYGEFLVLDIPEIPEKNKDSIFQSVESSVLEIVREDTFVKATTLLPETEKNKEAFKRAREKAKMQGQIRIERANKGSNQSTQGNAER